MMIEYTIFAPSNAILYDQNACLLSYNIIIEEGLVKILLDQDDRANKFCAIICVFARSYDQWSTFINDPTYLIWNQETSLKYYGILSYWNLYRPSYLSQIVYSQWQVGTEGMISKMSSSSDENSYWFYHMYHILNGLLLLRVDDVFNGIVSLLVVPDRRVCWSPCPN